MKKSKIWIKKFAKKNNSQGGGMEFTKTIMTINIVITEIPKEVEIVKNGWYKFILDDGKQKVSLTVRPRVWNRLVKAHDDFPMWRAKIKAKFGDYKAGMLFLKHPSIEIYEKKPKNGKQTETDKKKPKKKKDTITLKISEVPEDFEVNEDYSINFNLQHEDRLVAINLPVKMWSAFPKAKDTYPSGWIATITGKLKKTPQESFVLENPTVKIEGKTNKGT